METFTKEEIKTAIEDNMCRFCKNYRKGDKGSSLCFICKVSEVLQVIDNMHGPYFNAK